jgi:hypothetical protein
MFAKKQAPGSGAPRLGNERPAGGIGGGQRLRGRRQAGHELWPVQWRAACGACSPASMYYCRRA